MMERFGSGSAHCPENGSSLLKPTWSLSDLFNDRLVVVPGALEIR